MNRHSIKKKMITKMRTYIKRMMKKKMMMSKGSMTPIYSKIKKKKIRVRVNFKNI